MRYKYSTTNAPIKIYLKAKENIKYCRCGKSDNQPLCDRYSHFGSNQSPLVFCVVKEGSYYLCNCKKSQSMPYCDGSHKKIKES